MLSIKMDIAMDTAKMQVAVVLLVPTPISGLIKVDVSVIPNSVIFNSGEFRSLAIRF